MRSRQRQLTASCIGGCRNFGSPRLRRLFLSFEPHTPWWSHRHYATIGIEDVFLVPPARALPREYYVEGGNGRCGGTPSPVLRNDKGGFASEEITGVIQASPRDFVVREISPASRCGSVNPHHHRSNDQIVSSPYPRVADLGADDAADKAEDASQKEDRASVQFMADQLPRRMQNRRSESLEREGSKELSASCAFRSVDADEPRKRSATTATGAAAMTHALETTADPLAVLRQQLAPTQEGPEECISRLEALSLGVVEGLRRTSEGSSFGADVGQQSFAFRLDPRNHHLDDEEGSASNCMPIDRGIFHRSLRCVYPMLSAESSVAVCSTGPSDELDQQVVEGQEASGASYQVTVTLDPLFLSLAPLLHESHVDLPLLYAYYKGGLDAPEPTVGRAADGDSTGVLLRLKLDLPRAERKHVHHTIEAQSSQNLATTTRTSASPAPAACGDHAGAELDNGERVTITSIVVQ
jgi:hypothetical protein